MEIFAKYVSLNSNFGKDRALSDFCDKCEQRTELSECFLDEKETNKVEDEDSWLEYYCNQCLSERTDGVFTRTSD